MASDTAPTADWEGVCVCMCVRACVSVCARARAVGVVVVVGGVAHPRLRSAAQTQGKVAGSMLEG